ncbi:hypothetical protein AX14_013602, partial [Amanita brunnescens Koide BX004]
MAISHSILIPGVNGTLVAFHQVKKMPPPSRMLQNPNALSSNGRNLSSTGRLDFASNIECSGNCRLSASRSSCYAASYALRDQRCGSDRNEHA